MWGSGCVTAPAAWVSGPSTLVSRGLRGRRRRGTRGLPGRARGRRDTGVYTDRRKRPLGVVSGHLCTLLHPRAVSGGTSASTAMMCRRRPLGGHLSLGWENGLCASTAAARLASSPRQQPTQTPEEPSFGHIRTPAASSDVPGPSRGPSGCPRRRRLTGPASTSARCIPGSVSAGQGCLPRLPAPVPGGSTRASRSAQGTTGPVWSRRPAHLVRLALPSHPARARLVCLPSARPDRSIMAQRRSSNCGYVTSSHVLRPSGRGVGGARAGLPVRIDARPRRSVSNPRSPRTQAGYPARASPPAESSSLCGAARVWMRHACSLLIAHCSLLIAQAAARLRHVPSIGAAPASLWIARTHTATRARAYRLGTLDVKWQCESRCLVRSLPSGSVGGTATRP